MLLSSSPLSEKFHPLKSLCVQSNAAPGTGDGMGGKDARKLKLRVDELQTILAAEIKSRNISERELEQQIMSARENMNQRDDAGGGGRGGGNVGTAFAKKLAELSDKIHHTEASLEMETTERAELQRQLTAITTHESTVSSQIKKLETNLEKELFLNKVAADERKRQMELIRDAENKIVESGEKLAETEHKRKELQRESRNHIEHLEKKILDQAEEFQRIVQDQSAHVEQVAADMQTSQEKAAQAMEARIKEFEGKVLLMEKNMHATLSDGLRSLHNDMRVDRENAEASHQEMKEVLSAEITSRRKAVGKTNSNVEKLSTQQEDIIKNLQKLKSQLDDNVKEINEGLCKIAGGFSEQLITLQEVTKTAVRTLQIDQVSLTAKLKNSVVEYKQLHHLLDDRVNDCNSSIASVEESLKAQSKKLILRIDEVDGRLEEKSEDLHMLIQTEAKKREESGRKLTAAVTASAEQCSAEVQDLATNLEVRVNREATARSNALISSEKRLQDSAERQAILFDDKMSVMIETVNNEISYAISIENQTRSRTLQKMSKSLHSEMKTLSDTTNDLVAAESKERAADLVKTTSSLLQFEKTMAEETQQMENKHLDFIDTMRIVFEENDMNAKQAKCRLNRRLARQTKFIQETDDSLRELMSTNQLKSDKSTEKLFSGLAESDRRVEHEIGAVNTKIMSSRKSVFKEMDRREEEFIKRLKQELMQQLLANHVKAQADRKRLQEGLIRVEVRGCLDGLVNAVVEDSMSVSVGEKFEEVQNATVSDTTEAKDYVDLATKFLDKKLMAGFDDYNKRLCMGLDDVRVNVNKSHEEVMTQVEKNDLALLEHLKKIHAKGNERRNYLEHSLRTVEVSSCMDRMVNSIVESNMSASLENDSPANWEANKDESGHTFYYNKVTHTKQWEKPRCFNVKQSTESTHHTLTPRERQKVTTEIDMKINAVGIEVLDRVQKLQIRQKEIEETLESYNMPVIMSDVTTLRHDLDDAVEEVQVMKDELDLKLTNVTKT